MPAVGLLAVTLAGMLSVGIGASPASALPGNVTASPYAGLLDGTVITVSGSGFTPNAALLIGQCKSGGDSSQCSTSNYQATTASPSGTYSVSFTVLKALPIPNETVDCAAYQGRCVIGAAESSDVVGTATTTPIGFSAINASPSTGLSNGTVVTVSGTGFTPGATLGIGQCVAGTMGESGCGNNGLLVTASWTGSYHVTITVQNPLYIGAVPVNCSASGACVMGAAEYGNPSGTGVVTSLAFL